MMKILLIAEASAARPREFYNANNLLYKTVKQAFGEYFYPFESDEAFLSFFTAKGFGLEHLFVKTITKESASKRAEARKKCIPFLADRIKKEQPEMLIILLKTNSEEVEAAVKLSGINTISMIRTTIYPGLGENQRLACIETLQKLLIEAELEGII